MRLHGSIAGCGTATSVIVRDGGRSMGATQAHSREIEIDSGTRPRGEDLVNVMDPSWSWSVMSRIAHKHWLSPFVGMHWMGLGEVLMMLNSLVWPWPRRFCGLGAECLRSRTLTPGSLERAGDRDEKGVVDRR